MSGIADGEQVDLDFYGENVAAIAAAIHEDRGVYEKIYECLKDDGGFVGIWSLCANAGKIFHEKERRFAPGEDFDWIEAVECYAQGIIAAVLDGIKPTVPDLRRLAGDAIASSVTNGKGRG